MDKMKERTWVGGGEPIVNTQGHSVMWEPGWGVAGKQVWIRGGVGGRSADAFRSWWRGEERGAADVWTAMQILETKEMALLQSVPMVIPDKRWNEAPGRLKRQVWISLFGCLVALASVLQSDPLKWRAPSYQGSFGDR